MKKLLFPLALGAFLQPAQANNLLNPIQVSGAYTTTDEFNSSYTTYVFTDEDIRESGATSLTEFLSIRTPLIVSANYGNPFSPKIQIPGFGAEAGFESLKVIVDGRTLNNIDLLPALLSSVNLNNIQRITLVQGAGSVQYGDNSAAGALIIETKQPVNNNIALGLQYGSNADWNRYLNISLSEKTTNEGLLLAQINRSATSYDGDRLIKNDGTRNDRQHDTLNFDLGYENTLSSFHVGHTKSEGRINYPGALTVTQYYNNPATNPNRATSWIFARKDTWLRAQLKLNSSSQITYHLVWSDQQSVYPPYSSNYISRTHYLTLKKSYQTVNLIFGGEVSEAQRNNINNHIQKNRYALFTDLNGKITSKIYWNAGIRHGSVDYIYDDNSAHRTTSRNRWAWNLGLNYDINKQYAFYTNINRGYVMPNIDRFFTFTGTFNGFIEPMDTTTYTSGVKFRHGKYHGKFYAAYYDLENEFYYDAARYLNTNLNKTHKVQFGTDFNLTLDKLEARLLATHTNAYIDNASVQSSLLPGTAEDSIKVSLNYRITPILFDELPVQQLTIQHQWTSEALAESDFNKQFGYMPGSRRTDISLNLSNKRLSLKLGIKNLFNETNGIFVYSSFTNDIQVFPTDIERTYYVRFDYQLDL